MKYQSDLDKLAHSTSQVGVIAVAAGIVNGIVEDSNLVLAIATALVDAAIFGCPHWRKNHERSILGGIGRRVTDCPPPTK